MPHCGGTRTEAEDPLLRKAADVGGNVCFICAAVHTRTRHAEQRGMKKL